jgi:hypothetical protein
LNIQYQLKTEGERFAGIGIRIGVSRQAVFNVIFGRRRSARVEAEIARILGKADWNEVVLEARAAVTGKPVQAIVEEIQARLEARKKASAERFSAAMSDALTAAKAGARAGARRAG